MHRFEAVEKRKTLVKRIEDLDKQYDKEGDVLNEYNKKKRKDPLSTTKEGTDRVENAKRLRKEYLKEKRELQKEIDRLDLEYKYTIGPLSDYEEDCMYMSYRYCIGRSSIGSHYHSKGIAEMCYKRMSDERMVFTAYDINREIESSIGFSLKPGPYFHFPVTSLNKIYTSAFDIVCEFIQEEGIQTKEDFVKYKDVYIKITEPWDRYSEKYTYETVLWDDWKTKMFDELCTRHNIYQTKLPSVEELKEFPDFKEYYREIEYHNTRNFYVHELTNYIAWNDVCHLFDIDHHYIAKVNINNEIKEVEYFWTWAEDWSLDENGQRKELAFRKIRVPVQRWNPVTTTWIPDDMIIEEYAISG